MSDETAPEAWARCRPYIAAALDAADRLTTLAEVERQIEAGEAQFWAGQRSACVTQVIPYCEGKALNLWLCGGALTELRAMLPAIEAWARGQGCRAEYLAGRPAWRGVLSRHGFTPGHVVFEKEL